MKCDVMVNFMNVADMRVFDGNWDISQFKFICNKGAVIIYGRGKISENPKIV